MKYFSLHQQWVLFFIALLLLGILYFKFYYHPLPSPSEEFIREIVVEVSGEVQKSSYLYFSKSTHFKGSDRKGRRFEGNCPVRFNLILRGFRNRNPPQRHQKVFSGDQSKNGKNGCQ